MHLWGRSCLTHTHTRLLVASGGIQAWARAAFRLKFPLVTTALRSREIEREGGGGLLARLHSKPPLFWGGGAPLSSVLFVVPICKMGTVM